jgi:hypothetical protein
MQTEALAMGRKVLGSEHPDVCQAIGGLAATLLHEHKYAASEPLAREYMAVVSKRSAGEWEDFAARCLLGCALAGQRKYAEAEPLLTAAYAGMKGQPMPAGEDQSMKDALTYLAQLHGATGRPREATKYARELARYGR